MAEYTSDIVTDLQCSNNVRNISQFLESLSVPSLIADDLLLLCLQYISVQLRHLQI